MTTSIHRFNRIGIVLTGGIALVYLATIHLRPYPLSFLVKSAPVFLLSFLVLGNLKNSKGRLLALGLFFSGIGDVILALDMGGFFVLGMAAFAIAHLFYISVFLRHIGFSGPRFIVILLQIVYSSALGIVLYPKAGVMLYPILIYLVIILIMAISSALGKENHFLVISGACLFMLSDSLIAINQFVQPLLSATFWVMVTYYLAQGLIAYGTFKSSRTLD